MDNFAKRLKQILHEKGLKQTDLARMTGIDKSLISNYVSGKYKAKQDNLYLIAKALNVSEAWLMGYDTDRVRSSDDERSIENNSPPPIDLDFSSHEIAVISAYRNHPEMQGAVDKLLGVEREGADIAEDMGKTIRSGASVRKTTGIK